MSEFTKGIEVKVVSFDELPDWAKHVGDTSNGSGGEHANFLLIAYGDYKACYTDAMEPEDCKFSRDLSWIAEEIRKAYAPELREALEDLISLASTAMYQANRDGANYNVPAELEEARQALSKSNPK